MQVNNIVQFAFLFTILLLCAYTQNPTDFSVKCTSDGQC